MNAKKLDRLFYSLADETRREILSLLSKKEMTFGELTEKFETSKQAISKHLMVLEEAGFVKKKRSGRITQCKFEPAPLKLVLSTAERYKRFWEKQIDSLGDYLDTM